MHRPTAVQCPERAAFAVLIQAHREFIAAAERFCDGRCRFERLARARRRYGAAMRAAVLLEAARVAKRGRNAAARGDRRRSGGQGKA